MTKNKRMTKQCVAYYRVSSERQLKEGFSIPAQKKLIVDYARKNGYTIVKEFSDDESAGSSGRREFNKMIEYVNSPAGKQVGTILVEKTDRMYRNFTDYVIVEDLSIDTIFVKENEVVGPNATAHAKFVHGIKVLMAKNFLDNLSEEVLKGYEAKLRLGLYPGNPMFGYTTKKVDGKSVLTPKAGEAKLVERCYELYATGHYSVRSLIEKIKEEKLDLLAETKIYNSKVYTILSNPVYYGDFRWKGELHRGTHDPIVTKALWDKTQEVRERLANKTQAKRYNTKKFFLKGMMKCGECGRSITAEKKKGKYIYYRCTKHNTKCSQKAINEDKLLPQIEEIIKSIHIPKEICDLVAETLKDSLYLKQQTVNQEIKILKSKQSKFENRIEQIYEDKLDGVIDSETYSKSKQKYMNELQRVKDELSRYETASNEYYQLGNKILELSKKALRLYKQGSEEEKLELLSVLLSNFFLIDGKLVPNWQKPFDILSKHCSCSDWQGYQDSNPTLRFWRPTCYH